MADQNKTLYIRMKKITIKILLSQHQINFQLIQVSHLINIPKGINSEESNTNLIKF